MTILDKLLEKKDLRIYLDGRIAEVREEQAKVPEQEPPQERESKRERFKGRVKELERLRSLLAEGELETGRETRVQ